MKGYSVFRHYIPGLPNMPLRKRMMIRAIFRDDGKNADANIYFVKNKDMFYYHDFVTGEHLNPFEFIKRKVQCDNKTAYYHLRTIEDSVGSNASDYISEHEHYGILNKEFSISVNKSYDYWFPYGPRDEMQKTLDKFVVLSLENFSIKSQNGKQVYIRSNGADDPIFAFPISERCYKIYRPNTKDTQFKHLWLGNKSADYQNIYGITQLPDYSEYILIVEGLKDAIVSVANGVPAVGVDNVATIIPGNIIETLRAKCDHLLVCYDLDEPGLKGSEKISKEHCLERLLLPDSIKDKGGKDISDFFRLGHTKAELLDMITELVSQQDTSTGTQEINGSGKSNNRLSKLEQVEEFINQHYLLRFNMVSNQIEHKRIDKSVEEYKPLNDNNIYRFLQHNNIEISINKLKALLGSDFVTEYNPFHSYFDILPEWREGKDPDFIDLLCAYVPTLNPDRFRTQFKKALVRSVACAIHDAVINKQALILVHEAQNSGKSTFIRWLCPPVLQKYITESVSTDKDSLIALSDNFIINLDELAMLSRAEINNLKSMFSKETVKIRRPYDKNATSSPRRANFFGSTNKSEFLTDETGSVRWLCFELTDKINWNYNKEINIDDVWRQAYWLLKGGFNYELTFDEIRENDQVNQKFQVNTTELELIQKHYMPGTKDDGGIFYTSTDFMNKLYDQYPNARLNINNIGKALKLLGFERVSNRRAIDNGREKYPVKGYYMRFNDNDDAATTLPQQI